MAISEFLFDAVLFGLVFATAFLDRYLFSVHRYLNGASTAVLWAFLAYLSMWEMCRRSPLRRFRSVESLATALAASTVGLIFCLHGHDSPLVILVLSIGLMMGALMAAIAVVACFLDWKLSTGEWAFAGCWVVASVAGIAYLIVGKSPAAVAASTTQSLNLLTTAGAQEQAMMMGGTLLGVLLLLLLVKQPQRFYPTLGLVVTVGGALAWGLLCSQPVLLATEARPLPWMAIVAVTGILAWNSWRRVAPTDETVPREPPGAQPALVWVGPFGLTLYRMFDLPRVAEPASAPTASSGDKVSLESASMPAESNEPADFAAEEMKSDAAAPFEALAEPATVSAPPTSEPMAALRPLIAILFPPRLTERLVPAVLVALLLNLILR